MSTGVHPRRRSAIPQVIFLRQSFPRVLILDRVSCCAFTVGVGEEDNEATNNVKKHKIALHMIYLRMSHKLSKMSETQSVTIITQKQENRVQKGKHNSKVLYVRNPISIEIQVTANVSLC